MIENVDLRNAVNGCKNVDDLLLRLSAFSKSDLLPGKTIIFIDEIQEADDAFTIIKYLVEDNQYRYILSGSLLGIRIQNIQSFPVGFLQVEQMFPMDFEEFLQAVGVKVSTLNYLRNCYQKLEEVDDIVHQKILKLFSTYLIVGGMPEAVWEYVQTNNLQNVLRVQKDIDTGYLHDIPKYDKKDSFFIKDVYELIPSELNSQNKRFVLKELNQKARFYKYESSFVWLLNSAVGLFVYNVDNPVYPLLASKVRTLFKLFPSDIGLLSYKLLNGNQIKLLNGEVNINYGSFYESAVAQELNSHGFRLFYTSNKKYGEIDFLIEEDANIVPIEVKSGKNYKRHSAINNLLSNKDFKINKALILSNSNLHLEENKIYLPIYMIMFIENKNINLEHTETFFPKIDISDI